MRPPSEPSGPIDPPPISPDTLLWRRIPAFHIGFDKGRGCRVVSSAAFDDDVDGQPMSVVVARSDRDPRDILVGHDGYGLVAISVEAAEAADQRVVWSPTADEPDHGHVIGPKTPGRRKRLRDSAHWVIRPPEWADVELP
jgi:hypothetical protein